jgi:hypothetical protein
VTISLDAPTQAYDAQSLQRMAEGALDETTFATSVSEASPYLLLEIRDVVRAEGWRVVLPFSLGSEASRVEERVRKAVALRTWESSPPVVDLKTASKGVLR